MSPSLPHRRAALAAALPGSAALAPEDRKVNGNIKQSGCRWCFGKVSLPKLCEAAKKLGYSSIELLLPPDVKAVKEAGLTCAILRCASIDKGLNRKENHDRIVKELTAHIEF